MPAEIHSRPASAWQRITLDSPTRIDRTPRVPGEYVALKLDDGATLSNTLAGSLSVELLAQ